MINKSGLRLLQLDNGESGTASNRVDAFEADDRPSVTPSFGSRAGISAAEIAKAGLWGKTTTYKLLQEGRLKSAKVGSKRIILVESVRRLLEEAARGAPTKMEGGDDL